MKALLINLENRSVEPIDISGRDELAQLIGFDTVESNAVGTEGDRLFFDEACFLRSSSGRFQIDTLVPVSGKNIVVGTSDEGTTLRDVATDPDALRNRIKYL